MRIVLDNSVAGFLLVRHHKPGQESLAAASRRLLEDGEHKLLLPTPALAEALAWLPPDRRLPAVKLIQSLEMLEVVAFDTAAAVFAAELGSKKVPGRPTQRVKVDYQIVACARRYEADGICSADDGFAPAALRAGWALKIGLPAVFLRQLPLIG